MIPKKIHYCWFGGNPLPDIAHKCMDSWAKLCPDYEIICWNESNCDINSNRFTREAYASKKWAFVSDYIRLKVIEDHGGIYLDIDVELLRPLDELLNHQGFMGFEMGKSHFVATGLGFGAAPGHPVISFLRSKYENIGFINQDGSHDTTTCPVRDTNALIELGLKADNTKQEINGIIIYPSDYFSPISGIGERYFTDNTYSAHHFNGSWLSEDQHNQIKTRKQLIRLFGPHIGNAISLILVALFTMRREGFSGFMKKFRAWLNHKTPFKH